MTTEEKHPKALPFSHLSAQTLQFNLSSNVASPDFTSSHAQSTPAWRMLWQVTFVMYSDEPTRPLFQRVPGEPSGFYLHKSIKNKSQRESLRDIIVANGGKVLDEERGADTVLVHPKHLRCDIKKMQVAYSVDRHREMRQIVVEPLTFVQNCLRRKRFVHDLPKREAMGGYTNNGRTEFTQEDDNNLCWYISQRIPNPEDGGRLSYGIWKELLASAEVFPALAWAKRHTVESWREHYRKRTARFDPIIARYAREKPPLPTALYGLSRKYNKNPSKPLNFVRHEDDVIELTDESTPESEEGSGDESKVTVESQRRGRPQGQTLKASKRRRIEDSDGSFSDIVAKRKKVARLPSSSPGRFQVESSPAGKGKGKEIDTGFPEPDQGHRGSSPALEPFEPVLSQPQQPIRSPVAMHQADLYSTPPAPSPTLVQRTGSVIRSPPSKRRVNIVAPPSPHPSTSFHNVAHSSPIFIGTRSPNRSGIQSHNTSVTEPSSRSMVAPSELTRPSGNSVNVPAEFSITRESSHKPSSPTSQLMPMRKASRKLASRQPPVVRSPLDEDKGKFEQQESQWAPFKNTRSRSRSVESGSLPAQQRKKRGRNGKEREVLRNGKPLEPVHESEVERVHEIEMDNGLVNAVVTETMREEQNVVELLMLNPEEPVSGTLSGVSIRQAEDSNNDSNDSEDATEDEGEGVKRIFRREKEEEEEETQGLRAIEGAESADDEETAKFETAPSASVEHLESEFEGEEDDDIHDISSFSELEGVGSAEEDSALDISSDDKAIEQQFLSKSLSKQRGLRRRQRSTPSSDNEEVDQSPSTSQNTPLKTAKEVLDLFDSSPEVGRSQQQQRQQRLRYSNFRTGSPSPLQSQNRNRPRQSLPVSKSSRAAFTHARVHSSAGALVKATPVNQAIQKLTGPHRVSFSGGGGAGLSSSPSSIGSLLRTPLVMNPQPIQGRSGSQARSSVRRSIPLSQLRQAPLQSQSHSRRQRRVSAESTSSELQAAFPVSGTRASAVKQQLEQELKESPYTPPFGTRAAQIVVAERNLRPRRRA